MSYTFKVNEVEIGQTSFESGSLRKELAISLGAVSGIEGLYEELEPPLNWAFCSSEVGLLGNGYHGFVAACTRAYANHLPLRLSPDHLWTVIVQGLSLHIQQDPESYRHLFVEHMGKKTIRVRADYLEEHSLENWHRVFGDLRGELDNIIDPVLSNMICAQFSTTGALETAVYQASLLELVKEYISSEIDILCGIPEIKLVGTVSDWLQIKERIQMLEQFDLGWWIDTLEPIVDEFILAAQGKENREFWQSFVNREYNCGEYWTGSLVKLFPYLYQHTGYPIEIRHDRELFLEAQRNPHLYRKVIRNPYLSGLNGASLVIDNWPSGITNFPIVINTLFQKHEMEVALGFVGSRQNPITKEISPELGWGICYK